MNTTPSAPAAAPPHPYEALGPDAVLDAVESVGHVCDGRLLALNSYENRVYQVGIEDGEPLIAKFYRPGRWSDAAILEEHAFAAELAELEVPVVAPLGLADGDETLGHHGGFRFALFPRRPGRWPDLDTAEERERMGRFLGRLHAVGAVRPFQARPQLDVQAYGWGPLEALRASPCLPADMAANVLGATRALLDAVQARLSADDSQLQRVHGDLHLGNVLWSEFGPSIVDLDDCCMAPAVQDLWMLLAGDRHTREAQLLDVLRGYGEFSDLDLAELALIEPLRALRMVRFNGWLAERWSDPAFPAAFPWFVTPAYWSNQLITLREQLEALDEPPLEARYLRGGNF